MPTYRLNKNISQDDLVYHMAKDGLMCLQTDLMVVAIEIANAEFRKEFNFNRGRLVSLIDNVPKKNLSGACGECYGRIISILMQGLICKNLHESSGPDMLPDIPETKKWTAGRERTYCPYDGFDMKGCVTEGMHFMKVKPSSHHDQTTSVLTVQWKSEPGTYCEIVGVYYTRHLQRSDWKIIRNPKSEDSKLTSNARLLSSGVDKVRRGWVWMRDEMVLPRENKMIKEYGLDNHQKIDSNELFTKYRDKFELFQSENTTHQ